MRNAIRVALCIVMVWGTAGIGNQSLAIGSDGTRKLMIILDASGSMWGRMEGRTKIEIAREVLADVINQLPDGMEVGLVAYGHRVKGNCRDVELLVPLSPLNRKKLISTLNRLNPRGMTPMLYSVSETIKSLKAEAGETMVLLVSDGKETCAADPCAGIAELHVSNVNFVLHIVGFNVTQEEKTQLTCMADAGGGIYFSAENVAGLKGALQQIRETVSVGNGPGKLVLDKDAYLPLSTVTVQFEAQPDYSSTAWVGVIPGHVPHGKENVADAHDLSYQYLKKRTSGTLTFRAPRKVGDYDVRMFNTDGIGVETASASFKVTGRLDNGTLMIDKKDCTAYDSIHVTFTAPDWFDQSAWIGIVPSSVPHGKESDSNNNYITYQYVRSHSDGKMTFKAPGKLGSYDIRMFDDDNNGREMASATFQVARALTAFSLSLDHATYTSGAKITLTFHAPSTLPNNAWIGLIPSSVPHGDETTNDRYDLAYEYINNRSDGTMIFTAPDKPGKYDFRMHDTDRNGKELTHITFIVK